MKRLGTILLACALILGMSQCKKENTNTNAGNGQVYIELKVENGQRADVTPSTGAYDYSDGDKLLVGYNNAYVGYLEYNATTNTFSNTLNITQSGAQPLHFYYLNGQEPTETDNQYTFSISDQSAGLPVIAYAASRENFPSANGTYSAHLRNQCALVKFEVTGTSSYKTEIKVDYSSVTVDFSTQTLIPSAGNGRIKLDTGIGERWAILLPQEAKTATSFAASNGFIINQSAMDRINANDYLSVGYTINKTKGIAKNGW